MNSPILVDVTRLPTRRDMDDRTLTFSEPTAPDPLTIEYHGFQPPEDAYEDHQFDALLRVSSKIGVSSSPPVAGLFVCVMDSTVGPLLLCVLPPRSRGATPQRLTPSISATDRTPSNFPSLLPTGSTLSFLGWDPGPDVVGFVRQTHEITHHIFGKQFTHSVLIKFTNDLPDYRPSPMKIGEIMSMDLSFYTVASLAMAQHGPVVATILHDAPHRNHRTTDLYSGHPSIDHLGKLIPLPSDPAIFGNVKPLEQPAQHHFETTSDLFESALLIVAAPDLFETAWEMDLPHPEVLEQCAFEEDDEMEIVFEDEEIVVVFGKSASDPFDNAWDTVTEENSWYSNPVEIVFFWGQPKKKHEM